MKLFLSCLWGYGIHKSMVKSHCDEYKKVSSNEFIEKFNSVEWVHESYFKDSLFSFEHDSEIHASIFKVNKVGYIIKNPFEYYKVIKYINNFKRGNIETIPSIRNLEIKINNILKQKCEEYGIGLEYVDVIEKHEETETLGRICYHSFNGVYSFDNAKIQVLNRYVSSPYVLAHELGHYISISRNSDRSEFMADYEGNRLLLANTTSLEYRVMENSIKIYLNNLY